MQTVLNHIGIFLVIIANILCNGIYNQFKVYYQIEGEHPSMVLLQTLPANVFALALLSICNYFTGCKDEQKGLV